MAASSNMIVTRHDEIEDRIRFLWNQERYLLENIKLADTKAGFVLTISAAVLSASLSPSERFAFHFAMLGTARSYLGTGLFLVGLGMLITATLASAWSIKPRLKSDGEPSPVSWVSLARYKDASAFNRDHRAMTEEQAADLLSEQVYWMSRICVHKHRLISTSIWAALAGGLLVALAILVR